LELARDAVNPSGRDAADLDHPRFDGAIQNELMSAPTMPGNMEGTQARHDFAACLRSRYFGTVRKLGDRLRKSVPIDPRLAYAEILGCPREDVCEIAFCDRAEAKIRAGLMPLWHIVPWWVQLRFASPAAGVVA
jgi:hypothetical protein